MKKNTAKVICIIVFHLFLCALLMYCNAKIYIGFLGEAGIRILIYWCLTLLLCAGISLYKKISEPEPPLNLNIKCSQWITFLLKMIGILLVIIITFYTCKLLAKIILSNPYIYGNYIPVIYFFVLVTLSLYLIFCKKDVLGDAMVFHSYLTLFADVLCVCTFAIFMIGIRPVSCGQAYSIALESGLSDPVLLNHGETGDLSLYFGKWDPHNINWVIYEKNNMRIAPSELIKGEGNLGYYFFAGEKDGEPWGIAISEKTGRIIQQKSIVNPFLNTG